MLRVASFLIAYLFCILPAAGATSHAYVASGNFSYPLPPGSFASLDPLTGQLGAFRFGPSMVEAVAASPAGSEVWVVNQAASGSGQVQIASFATGAILATVTLPVNPNCSGGFPCASIAFRHDGLGAYVGIGTQTSSNYVFAVGTRKRAIVGTLPLGGAPYQIAVSPDDSTLCIGVNGVSCYGTASFALVGVVSSGADELAFAGPTLLAGDFNGQKLNFLNIQTFSVTGSVDLTGNPISLAVTADGGTVYVYREAFYSPGVDVVDVASMSVVRSAALSTPQLLNFAISPDGATLIGVTGSSYQLSYAELIGTSTLAVENQTPLICSGSPFYIGNTLYFYYSSSVMTIVDTLNAAVVGQIPIGPSYVPVSVVQGSAAYTANHRMSEVLVTSNSSTVVIDTAAGQLSAVLPYNASGTAGWTSGAAIEGSQLYTIGYSGLFDSNLATGVSASIGLPGTGNCVIEYNGIRLSPNGKFLFALHNNATCVDPARLGNATPLVGAAIYTTSNNALVAQISASEVGMAFSPGSQLGYLVAGNTITVVSTNTFTIAKTLQFPTLNLSNIVVSPDGLTIYGLSGGTSVAVIDLTTDQVVNQFSIAVSGGPQCLDLTQDGSTLLISSLSSPNQTKLALMSTATGAVTYVETGSVTAGVVAAR